MSAKFPGLPGPDFAENGLNRAFNFIQMQANAAKTPSAKVLASNVAANQTLAPVYVGPRRFHTVEVSGTFSATINIQGRVVGSTTFQTLEPTSVLAGTATSGAITTAGVYNFEGLIEAFQVVVSSYASGTIDEVRVTSGG